MNIDTLSILAINNLLMFWSAEGGYVTRDWKYNIIIIIIALLIVQIFGFRIIVASKFGSTNIFKFDFRTVTNA
jgi:hypothetical protein